MKPGQTHEVGTSGLVHEGRDSESIILILCTSISSSVKLTVVVCIGFVHVLRGVLC